MSLNELSLLRRLRSEVAEIPNPQADDARKLFRDLLDAAIRYNSQVLRQKSVGKKPDDPTPTEMEAWRNEVLNADVARRNAHEALISSYNALTRFCRKVRVKNLSIEAKFPAGSDRTQIGDMAAVIRRGMEQAKDLDETFFEGLSEWGQ